MQSQPNGSCQPAVAVVQNAGQELVREKVYKPHASETVSLLP